MTSALTIGLPVSIPLIAYGGTPPYTYSIASGLPAGLSLNAATGLISGTPTTVQSSTALEWSVTDSAIPTPGTATDTFLTVVQAVPVAVPFYSFPVASSGRWRFRGAFAVIGPEPVTVGLAMGSVGIGAEVDVSPTLPVATVGLALGSVGIGADVETVQLPFATVGLSLGSVGIGADVESLDPILTTANLHTYYNANFGVFQSNGGSVSADTDPLGYWNARGATVIDAEQTTAGAKPTMTTLNLLPSASFDGGDFMTAGSIGNWNFLHNSTGFTAVIVFKKAVSNPGTGQMMLDTVGISSANIGLSIFYEDRAAIPADDRLRVFIGRGVSGEATQDRQSSNGVLPGTGAHIIVVRFNGVSTLNARVDGVQVMNFTTNNFGTPSASNSTATLNIGRRGPFDDLYMDGQMPLISLFNDDLTLGQVEAIESYWMAQYGIT